MWLNGLFQPKLFIKFSQLPKKNRSESKYVTALKIESCTYCFWKRPFKTKIGALTALKNFRCLCFFGVSKLPCAFKVQKLPKRSSHLFPVHYKCGGADIFFSRTYCLPPGGDNMRFCIFKFAEEIGYSAIEKTQMSFSKSDSRGKRSKPQKGHDFAFLVAWLHER